MAWQKGIVMNIKQRAIIATACLLSSAVSAAFLAGCGGAASTSATSLTSSLTGATVDGYLQGATVFLDLNNDRQWSAGEPKTTTDEKGQYTLDTTAIESVTNRYVVVTGGIDSDTGYAFQGRLIAQVENAASGQVVTPLTTLAYAMVAQNLAPDIDAAKAQIAKVLGLSAGDLTLDPLKYLDTKPAIYANEVALQEAVQLIAAVTNDAGLSAYEAQLKVMEALALVVKAQESKVSGPRVLLEALGLDNNSANATAGQLAGGIQGALQTALQDQDRVRARDTARAALKTMDRLRDRLQTCTSNCNAQSLAGQVDAEFGFSQGTTYCLYDNDPNNDAEAMERMRLRFRAGT
jgi:hypothetical protein